MTAGSRSKSGTETGRGRTSPGAHLRAELLRLGLDQVAVSKATGVSRQSVNNIINGRQAISRAMAGKLGRLTGHGSDYWLSEEFSERGAPARRAVAGPLVNHQIARAVADGILVIKPFIAGNLQPASINLTLGGKGSLLEPGRAVSASAAERVELPYDYLGRLGAIALPAAGGLIVSGPIQIEPGFKGYPGFCLFNAGAVPFALRAHEPIVTLEIVRLSAAAEP